MQAINIETGEVIWQFHSKKHSLSHFVIADGNIYIAWEHQPYYFILDALTGEEEKKIDLDFPIVAILAIAD